MRSYRSVSHSVAIQRFADRLREMQEKYWESRDYINRAIFGIAAFFSTYVLLKLTSFLPDAWVLLFSVITLLLGFKNSKGAYFIIVVTLSISLIYQNTAVGLVTFFVLLFTLSYFRDEDRISQSLALSLVPLMYYKAEFFPIIAAALLHGYGRGLKMAFLAFTGGLFFSNILPYRSFGHFSLEFDNSLISSLKPPVANFSLSSIFSYEPLNQKALEGLILSLSSSQLLPIMLVAYLFIGLFPPYVRDMTRRFGDIWLLFGLLLSGYAVFFFINYIYYWVPGFELSSQNLLSIGLSVFFAWLLYLFLFRGSPPEVPLVRLDAQVEADKRETIVSEGSRLDALKKEMEKGGKED